jgi:hypothetical protein
VFVVQLTDEVAQWNLKDMYIKPIKYDDRLFSSNDRTKIKSSVTLSAVYEQFIPKQTSRATP